VADDLAGILDEHDQKVECPVAQWKRNAVPFDLALGREQPKRPE
jgi:hypothetical protein